MFYCEVSLKASHYNFVIVHNHALLTLNKLNSLETHIKLLKNYLVFILLSTKIAYLLCNKHEENFKNTTNRYGAPFNVSLLFILHFDK